MKKFLSLSSFSIYAFHDIHDNVVAKNWEPEVRAFLIGGKIHVTCLPEW